jgi:hypothetical protein
VAAASDAWLIPRSRRNSAILAPMLISPPSHKNPAPSRISIENN